MPLTMYSFGYWGWGNHTRELVQSIDAVERHHGYRPPLFVDIRLYRTVRAKGFQGNAFEETVGKRRYRWMPELGNRSVLPGQPSNRIRIDKPAAAVDLLLLARQEQQRHKRHVIFFCSCADPAICHRHTVAKLLIREAQRQNIPLEVTEWPGGEPARAAITAPIDPRSRATSTRLRLLHTRPMWKLAGLPYGTRVRIDRTTALPVMPMCAGANGWFLQVVQTGDVPGKATPATIARWRKTFGHGTMRSSRR